MADSTAENDMALLEAALLLDDSALLNTPPWREAVPGVEGAFLIRGALSMAETGRLAAVVRRAHAASLGQRQAAAAAEANVDDAPVDAAARAALPRRDSQHHVPLRARLEALGPLCARLRPCLSPQVGPEGGCPATLRLEGAELSAFLRCYAYGEVSWSAAVCFRCYL
jgi:hypothetical protein